MKKRFIKNGASPKRNGSFSFRLNKNETVLVDKRNNFFTKYIRYPELIDQSSYQELKTLWFHESEQKQVVDWLNGKKIEYKSKMRYLFKRNSQQEIL